MDQTGIHFHVHVWGRSEKWVCIRVVYWGKDTQLLQPVFPVPYFVHLKVFLCRLDISEFSAYSCCRCCVRCNISWWVGACTACRPDTPVAPAQSWTDRGRSFSPDSSFLANTKIKNKNSIEFNDSNDRSSNRTLYKLYTPISQLGEIIKPIIKIRISLKHGTCLPIYTASHPKGS